MTYRPIVFSLLLLTCAPAWANDLDGLDLTITIPTSPNAIFSYEDADGNTVTEGLPGYDDTASLPDESDFNEENVNRTITNYGESVAASATQTVNASIDSKPDVDASIEPQDPSSIDDVALRDCSHADIDCERSEGTSSDDVPAAATWIGVVTSAGNDTQDAVDRDSIRIFHGKGGSCRSWSAYGSLNCCTDSGFISNFTKCDESEKDVGAADSLGAAVRLGEYCSSHARFLFVKWCETKRTVYCVFKSKLDRIVQQQIRIQTKTGFGSWNNHNCDGQHPDAFVEKISLSKLDLSEYLPDAADDVNYAGSPSQSALLALLNDRISPPSFRRAEPKVLVPASE